MSRNLNSKNTNTENIDVIATKIDYIQRDVADIKRKLEADYVTQDEFKSKIEPLTKFMWGTVSLIVTAVGIAVINLVLKTQ